MVTEEKLNKLTELCNNLDRGFRKLTEDIYIKFIKVEGQIKTIQVKYKILEEKIKQINYLGKALKMLSLEEKPKDT